jgi:hypothetical protein
MRQINDGHGRAWEAVGVPTYVAHMREGRILGFRPADDPAAEPVLTTVSFNSAEAAEGAIRTMSDKELRRRLDWAKTSSGVV